MGLLQHSPRRITKPYTAFCETKKSRALSNPSRMQTLAARSRPGGPVPVARSATGFGPVVDPIPVARFRWPGPGGPVPGPVPMARSRWPGPGPALRARVRGPARKKTYSGKHRIHVQVTISRMQATLRLGPTRSAAFSWQLHSH